jgi:preprotein translocase subunit SecE
MAKSSSAPGLPGAEAARRGFSFRVIGEAVSELRRVTWPTRQETMRLSIMVVSVAMTVGVFLGVIDMGFTRLFDVVLQR